MAAIFLGVLTVIGGLLISGYYLAVVRPEIAAAENGEIPECPQRRRLRLGRSLGRARLGRRPGGRRAS